MKTEFEILLKEAIIEATQAIKKLPKEILMKRLEQSKDSAFTLALTELNQFSLPDICFSKEREEISLSQPLSNRNFIYYFSQVELELSEFKLLSANDEFYFKWSCENLLAA